MNMSFPMSTSRMPVLVERRAMETSSKASAETAATNVRREGAMKRFLRSLLRSLAAVCA